MHNNLKVKIRIKKHGLHSKHKLWNKLSMQRTLQGTHENWISRKSIFLELIINILVFSSSKQDKSEKTCNYLNKSNKIILDTRHEYKANKTCFTILSLSSKKFYIKPF